MIEIITSLTLISIQVVRSKISINKRRNELSNEYNGNGIK